MLYRHCKYIKILCTSNTYIYNQYWINCTGTQLLGDAIVLLGCTGCLQFKKNKEDMICYYWMAEQTPDVNAGLSGHIQHHPASSVKLWNSSSLVFTWLISQRPCCDPAFSLILIIFWNQLFYMKKEMVWDDKTQCVGLKKKLHLRNESVLIYCLKRSFIVFTICVGITDIQNKKGLCKHTHDDWLHLCLFFYQRMWILS